MRTVIIAIDGPAGSGKTTSAKIIAEKLGYIYIDTGAMYRAVTLAWLDSSLPFADENLQKIVDSVDIRLELSSNGQVTMLNGEDVSEQIRSVEVNQYVSPVSANEYVREKMVALQRNLAKDKGCVMDGRDIGTTVFPNADLKFYLTASIGARSKRRLNEYKSKGVADLTYDDVAEQIVARDNFDSSRPVSPLRKADDAIEIDTSDMTLEEQADKMYEIAMQVINS